MNKQEKNKKLIAIVNNAIEEAQKYKETLAVGEEKDAGDLINVLNSALYRLGVRKAKKKSVASKDAFSKKETAEGKGIKNNAPKDAFKKKDFKQEFEEAISNNAPKDAFKVKQLEPAKQEEKTRVEEAIKRTGDKWNKRLSKDKKTQIKALFDNNFSIEQISNELWIEEKIIKKFLGIKAPSVVIADNTTNETDEFIQQVKESKENG